MPPIAADAHSEVFKAFHANWVATRDEEQAVSTVMVGPTNPYKKAMRPDITLLLPNPVTMNGLSV